MFAEHDVVRILTPIPAERTNCDMSKRSPVVGDEGTIVCVYPTRAPQEPMFIVECVADDGSTEWIADVFGMELALVVLEPLKD